MAKTRNAKSASNIGPMWRWDGWSLPALVGTGLVLFGALWAMISLQAAVTPFALGFVLAYLLQPASDWTERNGLGRSSGALAALAALMLLVAGLFAMWVPLVVTQLSGFMTRLPSYLSFLQARLAPWLESGQWNRDWAELLRGINPADLLQQSAGLGGKAAEIGLSVGQGVLGGVIGLIGGVTLVVFALVVAFYLLVDWRHVLGAMERTLPKPWRPEVHALALQIDTKLAAYLRGQVMVCAVLAAFYGTALTVMGLELGWAIGLITGVLAFIPVLGATIGALLMVLMAVVQFQFAGWEPYAALLVIFTFGQVLEGYILTPYLVGRQVGLHPLWVMFALMAGGVLAGFVGMLLALPMAVILSVILPRVLGVWRATVEK